MKFKFIIILFLGYLCGYSQKLTHYPIIRDTEPEDSIYYRLNNYRIHLSKKYKDAFSDENKKMDFIDEVVSSNLYYFEAGKIYYNWNEAEDYLNEIVKTIIQDTLDSHVKVKIVRSPDDNAFMIEDGTIYINVGLLANVNNEAELAATIGHEYGHYKLKHALKSYKITKRNAVNQSVLSGTLLGFGLKSISYANKRDLEREADRVSLQLLMKSNFDPRAFVTDFERYEYMYNKYKKSPEYNRSYFNDHPSTSERISLANYILTFNKSDKKNKFLVSEERFNKIKRQAIDETIFLHLQSINFEEAISLCYRELILHSEDEFYLFYLAESLRRQIEVNPTFSEEYFVTGNYAISSEKSLIDNLNPVVISSKYKELKKKELSRQSVFLLGQLVFYNKEVKLTDLPYSSLTNLDTLEFVTNNDAFVYFKSRLKKLNYRSVKFIEAMENPLFVDSLHGFETEITNLQSYEGMFKFYKDYNEIIEKKNVELIVYNLSINTPVIYKSANDSSIKLLEDGILRNLSRPNGRFITQISLDSIKRQDRNGFLLLCNSLVEKFDAKKSYETGVPIMKTQYAINVLSISPELAELFVKNQKRAAALVSLGVYINAGKYYSYCKIHMLDFKRKRITAEEYFLTSSDEFNMLLDQYSIIMKIDAVLNPN